MGLASRGCLALVLGATAERRNLFFRSDLGLPWIRTRSLRLSRQSTSKTSWAEPSTGISPSRIPRPIHPSDECPCRERLPGRRARLDFQLSLLTATSRRANYPNVRQSIRSAGNARTPPHPPANLPFTPSGHKHYARIAAPEVDSANHLAAAGSVSAGRENKQKTCDGEQFEITKDKPGKFRFRLKAANREIIATSKAYESKASAKNGIESVQKNAPAAAVVDLTEETAKK
jgi:uncharacterized protein YegP (UPF0339 family)